MGLRSRCQPRDKILSYSAFSCLQRIATELACHQYTDCLISRVLPLNGLAISTLIA